MGGEGRKRSGEDRVMQLGRGEELRREEGKVR